MSMFLSVPSMNARFGKHTGILLPDGRAILYGLEFQNASHALRFLEPYPAGPEYKAVYTPSIDEVILEVEHEATFEFGPPMD